MIHCDHWLWVSLPSATFALGISDGRVAVAPPYARKMRLVGMREDELMTYLGARRGCVIRLLPRAPSS